jgi:RNase P subunit RPR2
MPIVKDKIHKAAKMHYCDDCRGPIEIGSKYRRLFGNADDGNPLYELKLCHKCTEVNEKTEVSA